MRHLRVVTRPAKAVDINDATKFVGLLTATLYFITSFANAFGIQLPQKVNDDSQA